MYKTNQATDNHFCLKTVSEISDGDSVWLESSVESKAEIIKGGHRFFKIKDSKNEVIKCAAFEPTKEFRNVIDELEIGDSLIVYGSVNNNTINLEKIKINSLVKRFLKPENPLCTCGRRTHSSGKDSYYRCKLCGLKYDRPKLIESSTTLSTIWYEPTASARRHLTTPISLMR